MTELSAEETKYFEGKGANPIPGDTELKTEPEKKEGVKPEVKPEAKAEPKTEPEKLKPPPGFVAQGALDEERNRRKKADKERETLAQQLARLTGRVEALSVTKEEKKPEIPDFQIDPARNLDARIQTQAETVEELRKWKEDQAREADIAQKRADFLNLYREQATKFQAETKDFPQAYKHLLEAKDAELQAAGIDSQAERQQTLGQWEAWIVEQAMRRDRNPASALYEMAKKAGYTAAQQKTEEDPDKAKAERDPDTGQFKKVEEKLDKIAEGIAKSKSIGAVSGTGAEGLPKLETVLNMDDEEFEKIAGSPKNWKKLMG